MKCIQYSRNRQRNKRKNLLAINVNETLKKKYLHDLTSKKVIQISKKNMSLLFSKRHCIDIFM